eukprot:403333129
MEQNINKSPSTYIHETQQQSQDPLQIKPLENNQQSQFATTKRFDHQFKIIIIGDPCCGKTSLLMRIAENKRNEQYEMTVGVDCKSRTFLHEKTGQKVRLQIWDTAGQDRFTSITTSYYRGTHCAILVFDITNSESFFHLFKWIDQYNYYNDFPIKNIVIIGNKHDLEQQRAISRLEIGQFCDSMECEFIEVSVLDDLGVEKLIERVIEKCLELQNRIDLEQKEQNKENNANHRQEIYHNAISLKYRNSQNLANIRPLDLKQKKRGCC